MASLVIERGKEKGKRFNLEKFPLTIGRERDNAIVIQDTEISRYHIKIKKRGRLFIIEDLQSRNGTHINGDKVLNSLIKNGDKILIGNTELMFLAQESGIQLEGHLKKYDMLVAENIAINSGNKIDLNNNVIAKRFPPHYRSGKIGHDFTAVQKIVDLHSNILVINDLKEVSKLILKSIGNLLTNASRACIFQWNNDSRKLSLIAKTNFQQDKPFIISHRLIEEVISRKQGVLVHSGSMNSSQPEPHRLVLPIIQNDEPICVLHIEADDPRVAFNLFEIEMVQALIHRCAPSIESLMLRREIDSWMVGITDTIISVIEAKDTYTRGHSDRVAEYSMAIANELRLNRETKRLLLVSSLCHDIGKVGIPDNILKKAASLTTEEYEEIKLHPTIGANIIKNIPNAHRFMSGIKYHHEKWDGTGYPEGLVGEDIPFFGRIVAIADTFDAMVSGRSYTGFMDQGDAIARLETEIELFDPDIFRAFVRAYENGTLTIRTDTQSNAAPGHEAYQGVEEKELQEPLNSSHSDLLKKVE